jgi:hypothetical protein
MSFSSVQSLCPVDHRISRHSQLQTIKILPLPSGSRSHAAALRCAAISVSTLYQKSVILANGCPTFRLSENAAEIRSNKPRYVLIREGGSYPHAGLNPDCILFFRTFRKRVGTAFLPIAFPWAVCSNNSLSVLEKFRCCIS